MSADKLQKRLALVFHLVRYNAVKRVAQQLAYKRTAFYAESDNVAPVHSKVADVQRNSVLLRLTYNVVRGIEAAQAAVISRILG